MAAPQPAKEVKNLAIVVGKGLLPQELVKGLQGRQKKPILIGIKGEAESWLSKHEHVTFSWEEFGRFSSFLKRNNVNQIMFAGGVSRPKLQISKMDFGALMALPSVMKFMIGGDNSLLSGLIKLFDKQKIEVIGAHEALPDLLSTAGVIAGAKPSAAAMKNIQKAYHATKLLGELDIGQAAVAIGGRVIALEGLEGTDNMLQRVCELRASGRLRESAKHGVLVKTMKPGQDMRADLPAIGPNTIEMLKKARLQGVAIEAGHSIILAREETLAAAKKSDIYIYGLTDIEGRIA